MDSFLGGLCVLGVVLGIVAVVGHGMWVAVAAINRAISGTPQPAAAPPRHCPWCRAVIPVGRNRCPACDGDAVLKPQPPLRTLEALVAQVERLHKLGSLDALSFEQLNDALQTELERVRSQLREEYTAKQEVVRAQADKIESASIFEIVADKTQSPGQTQVGAPAARHLPQPAVAAVEAAPAPPARTWSQVLDGFMEERNLRWGELIGGMLIVCGSIALVISFWSQIAERPFLKFFVFNGFTAAMFGAGAYCDRRLRLATTSRGIYSIATLLVPLNFLALAAFSRDSSADSILTIAGELISIGLFAWLTWLAGRTTTPQAAALLSVGVVGPSVAALLVRRFVDPDTGVGMLYALGILPVAFYIAAVATSLWRAGGTHEPDEPEVHSQFRLLGVTTFAAILPLGLLVTRSGDVTGTLRWLAPLMSLAAAPGLATGLFVWKRVTTKAHTELRTTGSAIAIAGILILLAGIAFAWPHPTVLLLVAAVDFLVLSAIAFTQAMPAAHLLALPCLGLAYLIVVHVARGDLSWGSQPAGKTAGALLSAASGTSLAPLAVIFGGTAGWLARTRRDDSRFYGIVAALSAGMSLVLVTCFGLGRFGDPGGATWVYGFYAAALLVVAVVLDRRSAVGWAVPTSPDELANVAGTIRLPSEASIEGIANKTNAGTLSVPATLVDGHSPPYEKTAAEIAAWGGAGLLLVAFIQGAVFNLGHTFAWQHPWLLAFLGHASALTVAALAINWRKAGKAAPMLAASATWPTLPASAKVNDEPFNASPTSLILSSAAVMTSIAGAACLTCLVPTELPGQIASHALWLSGVWCLLAWHVGSRRLFAAFQAGLTATVTFAVAAWIHIQPWGTTRRDIWLDPWSWQFQGVALSLLGLFWVALRRSTKVAGTLRVPSEATNEGNANQTDDGTRSVPATLGGQSPPYETLTARLHKLLSPVWPACDRVVGWSVLVLFITMAVYGAVPGVAQELSPRALAAALETSRGIAVPPTGRVVPALSHFEFMGIPHGHALGWGAWAWLASVAVLFVAWQREKFRVTHSAGILVALSAACPLLAGLWETDVAAASALRWTSALFLAVASASIWIWQTQVERRAAQAGALAAPVKQDGTAWLTALVLVVSAAPLAAMGLFVGTAALWRYALDDALQTTLVALIVVCFIAVPIGVVLRVLSSRWIARLPAETVLATAAAARRSAGGLRQASVLIWILGAGPLLAVGLFIVSAALRGNPIVGPEPGTLFQRMGLATSYATPVALCALTLVGFAVRERSSAFSFAAGLLFNVSATAAYLLLAARGGLKLDAVLWVRLAQLNAIVSAVYGLCWMAAVKFGSVKQHQAEALAASDAGRPLLRIAGIPIPGLLVTQALIGVALTGIILVPASVGLFLSQQTSPALAELAEPLGRTAWFLTLAGVFVLSQLAGTRPVPGVVCAALWSMAIMATSYACRWDAGDFVAYRTLLAAHSLAAWCLLPAFAAVVRATEIDPAIRRAVVRWTVFLGLLVIILAWRHVGGADSAGPSVAAILSQSVLAAVLASWTKERGFVYLTGMLSSLAQTLWWMYGTSPGPNLENEWTTLLDVNVRAWLLPAIASLLIERWIIEPSEERDRAQWPAGQQLFGIGFHRVAGVLAVACLVLVAGAGLLIDAGRATLTINPVLQWQALACGFAVVAACLWDAHSVAPTFGLYLLGLVTAAITLNRYHLEPRMIAWNGVLILAGYAVVTALLWLRRSDVGELARICRIPRGPDDEERVHHWLNLANGVLSVGVLVGAIVIDLTFAEKNLRLATGTAALIPGLAIGLLARRGLGVAQQSLEGHDDATPMLAASATWPTLLASANSRDGRTVNDCITALMAGMIGIVAWSWAWLTPHEVDAMHRFVVMTAALAATTVVYGLGLTKLFSAENAWARAGSRLAPVVCVLTLASVGIVIGNETSYYLEMSQAPMAKPAILVMALTILGLCAAALTAALVPGRDPLNLSEHGRTAYVYATEALLAVLFLHVRFTMPWMFHGFLTRYWPFIVMFIAFTGVGVSEIFRRQRRPVLADPLERTGALLPVLPILGFWAIPNEGHFSLVLLAAGAIYSMLSLMRRSFGFGFLAAVAANGGLWYYLQHVQGYGFLQHPQLWMIPFAVCVLGAAYLNRERLSAEQMTTIRYLASITIYVSSTADIFLNGVSQAPWLPVVLAGLAVGGMFVGIILRMRAFLFLGTGFLALAMLTIIWHAAVDLHHTWLIWLTVVFAGVFVLGIFAVFEKKRQEILHVVDKIKQWSP